MPKRKQPDSLQEMALGVLREFVLGYCNGLSDQGSEDELRQGISIIKQHICNFIPWHLLADFCSGFLDEFQSKNRPFPHLNAALEILMDVEIFGLRCKGPILAHLDPKDVHRLKELKELDLESFPAAALSMCLDNFQLDHLTTFVFAKDCTDLDLVVVGRNCSKLRVLKVQDSKVTDEGLQAVRQCSELRVVDISGCPVSHSGLNELLSEHDKIEEFTLRSLTRDGSDFDVFLHLDPSVCSSMSHLVYMDNKKRERDRQLNCYSSGIHSPRNIEPRAADLQGIVTKFPNLTYLAIIGTVPEDLSAIRSLSKISGLVIHFGDEMFIHEVNEMWDKIRALLTSIGANITTFKISHYDKYFTFRQEDVNFIFDSCPNIEHLDFPKGEDLVVIPPFQKLKELAVRPPEYFSPDYMSIEPTLEFGKLANLETLWILNYVIHLWSVESIVLDNANFPNLSLIKTNYLEAEHLVEIARTAKTNNLDIKLEYDPETNYYLKFRSFLGVYKPDDDSDDCTLYYPRPHW